METIPPFHNSPQLHTMPPPVFHIPSRGAFCGRAAVFHKFHTPYYYCYFRVLFSVNLSKTGVGEAIIQTVIFFLLNRKEVLYENHL